MQKSRHSPGITSCRLSVTQLANYGMADDLGGGGGLWRAQLGTHWHGEIRRQLEAAGEDWGFERQVEGLLLHAGWEFNLRGRVDQWRHEDGRNWVREVKTVAGRLPAPEDELRSRHRPYFHQACLYAYLMADGGQWAKAEVLFVEISSGLTQRVEVSDEDLAALGLHLNEVTAALNQLREHSNLLRKLEVPPPFKRWRPGQREARKQLRTALSSERWVNFEAPTGFGKTGLALDCGLRALVAGDVDRIILLTGKNTGHSALLQQLEKLRRAGMHSLRAYAIRSRKDLREEDEPVRLSAAEITERWRSLGRSAASLLEEGEVDLDQTRLLAHRCGLPPWIVSRLLLRAADVWIADYNYCIDPAVMPVFEAVPGYDPARSFLIIDEAHNLPERARSCRSHSLDKSTLSEVLTQVRFAHFSPALERRMDQLLSWINRKRPEGALDPDVLADLIDRLSELSLCWSESAWLHEDLPETCLEWLWSLAGIVNDLRHPSLEHIVYAPRHGRLVIDCVDAASVLNQVLQPFAYCLPMSATLSPWPQWAAAVGRSFSAAACVHGKAPWLNDCFHVMVDARADTRFQQRQQCIPTTALAIGKTARATGKCLPVFFPSYHYAEQVQARVQSMFPELRCDIQPRDANLEEQMRFLDHSLMLADVLFLILGSRFSEGIDALGGRVHFAIVVSPALPEVNPLQKAREALPTVDGFSSFEQTYLLPGMRKVNQALGRLVRAPEHRVTVLLHCQRFAQPAYQRLLPEFLLPKGNLLCDEDFDLHWLPLCREA